MALPTKLKWIATIREKVKKSVIAQGALRILRAIFKAAPPVSVFLAAISLITSLYPQLIPGNDNLINKANAGNVKSQMLLAEHYFEIGEYGDSIYWYKIASAGESGYQAVACNNLGFLYAKGFGLSDYENEGFYQYEKALRLFAEAYEIGSMSKNELIKTISESNGINILRYNSDDCFPNSKDYTGIMSEWNESAGPTKTVVSYGYKSFETYKGKTYQEGNTLYTYSGPYTGLSDNGYYTSTYHMYYGQTYEPDTESYNPTFIYLSDLTDG